MVAKDMKMCRLRNDILACVYILHTWIPLLNQYVYVQGGGGNIAEAQNKTTTSFALDEVHGDSLYVSHIPIIARA